VPGLLKFPVELERELPSLPRDGVSLGRVRKGLVRGLVYVTVCFLVWPVLKESILCLAAVAAGGEMNSTNAWLEYTLGQLGKT
jgi:hypothetical protein